MAILEITNLSYDYITKAGRVHAVKDATASFDTGIVYAIVGRSGSGKSTFLRCLNCMEDPSGGKIIFDGVNIADLSVDINVHRQKIGMVFQHFNLFPHLTILENVTLAPIRHKMMTEEQAKEKAMELLNRVGVGDKADNYPAQLSGGQKQRLCIARALLKKPKILILDDSTSAVDTVTDAKIRKAFREEIPDTTKIIIAQRISSVAHADKIVILEDGKIHATGTHEELLKNNLIYQEIYQSQQEGADL